MPVGAMNLLKDHEIRYISDRGDSPSLVKDGYIVGLAESLNEVIVRLTILEDRLTLRENFDTFHTLVEHDASKRVAFGHKLQVEWRHSV